MSETLIRGRVSRRLPQPDVNGGRDGEPMRTSIYGDQYVKAIFADDTALADEGSLYAASAQGVATIAAQSSLADTAPFLLIKNDNELLGDQPSRRIYLRRLTLVNTAPGTAGASLRFAVKVDAVNSLRYTSGASGLIAAAGVNVNMDDARVSRALIYSGPIVATAATGSVRKLAETLLKNAIPAAGDEYTVVFGATDTPAPRAAATWCVKRYSPVIIGPQQWAAVHIWLPSQSAASSYDIELEYAER